MAGVDRGYGSQNFSRPAPGGFRGNGPQGYPDRNGGGGRPYQNDRSDYNGRNSGRNDYNSRNGEGYSNGYDRPNGRQDSYHGYGQQQQAEEGTAARPGKSTNVLSKKDELEKINRALAAMDDGVTRMGTMRRPTRSKPGTRGMPCTVKANHFKVSCTLKQAVHYDVTIEGISKSASGDADAPPRQERGPKKPLPADLCRQVMQNLAAQERWDHGWVFDGRKNLYSPNHFLPKDEKAFEVVVSDPNEGRDRHFKVVTKWAAFVDIENLLRFVKQEVDYDVPQEAIQALDIALKHGASQDPNCQSFARAFFFNDKEKIKSLSNGAEVWLGYQQSLRPCQGGLSLNVDIAATAFLEVQPVIDYLARSAGLRETRDLSRGFNPQQFKRATKAIAGIIVQATHEKTIRRKYKVKQLSNEGARRLMFFNPDADREMSVAEYFEMRYHIRLQYPDIPCLNVGTPRKPVYLPAEVCQIKGGQRRLKLDERQTAEMIKTSAQPPASCVAQLEKSVNLQARLPEDPTVAAFGMKVAKDMMQIQARHLAAPMLQYRDRQPAGNFGNWDLRNNAFFKPAALTSFGVACFADERRCGRGPTDEGSLEYFLQDLVKSCRAQGMAVPTPNMRPRIVYHKYGMSTGETLKAACEEGQRTFQQPPKIIFVCLGDTGSEQYNEVKRAGDSFLAIPTQCFVTRKASIGSMQARGRPQYCANLGMKINAKLGGINCILHKDNPLPLRNVPGDRFMIFGADVTHPLGFSDSEPSIAAVCSSLDFDCVRYQADVRLQGHRVEIIQDLKTIVKEQLKNFRNVTKEKPTRLIFYRDGVSEGQFQEVQRCEIPQIVQACRELQETYRPAITFIVVQKRHHTRLFPQDDRKKDKSGNCLPGTVVDHTITHPFENDFYLQSHAGIQGTSRPTHYHVLMDQNNLSADDLQELTYRLCYLFCRCTRSVSVCPPAYYAHLAAFRGRAMLSRSFDSSDSESQASGGKGRAGSGSSVEFAEIPRSMQQTMFYV